MSTEPKSIEDQLTDAFLCWPLPESVCSDLCVTDRKYKHRSGTNLLTFTEAKAMIEAVVMPMLHGVATEKLRDLELENTAAWTEVEKLKRGKKIVRITDLRAANAKLEQELKDAREEVARYQGILARIRDASAPVRDWYLDKDEEPEPLDVQIKLAIDDLIHDRKEANDLRPKLTASESEVAGLRALLIRAYGITDHDFKNFEKIHYADPNKREVIAALHPAHPQPKST